MPRMTKEETRQKYFEEFKQAQAIEKELEENAEGFQRYLKFIKTKKKLQKLLKVWTMDEYGRMRMYEGSLETLFEFMEACGFKIYER